MPGRRAGKRQSPGNENRHGGSTPLAQTCSTLIAFCPHSALNLLCLSTLCSAHPESSWSQPTAWKLLLIPSSVPWSAKQRPKAPGEQPTASSSFPETFPSHGGVVLTQHRCPFLMNTLVSSPLSPTSCYHCYQSLVKSFNLIVSGTNLSCTSATAQVLKEKPN